MNTKRLEVLLKIYWSENTNPELESELKHLHSYLFRPIYFPVISLSLEKNAFFRADVIPQSTGTL
jgi:hypothetical protein